MIDNLRISYDCGSHVSVTLSADTDYENNTFSWIKGKYQPN